MNKDKKLVFFKRLDRKLSKKERDELRDAEDLSEYHWELGAWIRNNWIYGNNNDFKEAFLENSDAPIILADLLSATVIEEYQAYRKSIPVRNYRNRRIVLYRAEEYFDVVDITIKEDEIVAGESQEMYGSDWDDEIYGISKAEVKQIFGVKTDKQLENVLMETFKNSGLDTIKCWMRSHNIKYQEHNFH